MLELFSRHGFFDLTVEAEGDIEVDSHHTIEDMGITLGKALREALPAFAGVRRYGHAVLPMDEALCMVAIDLCGRPGLVWNGEIGGKVGTFDGEVVKEFFQGFANEARITLHVNLLYGENLHHKIEAIFKASGRALREAVATDERVKGATLHERVLMMIAIVDYGMGNLRSVTNAFRQPRRRYGRSRGTQARIREARALVLPGVGAFGKCVENLKKFGLFDLLKEQIAEGKPYLGICLGMQILLESSEETPGVEGMGVIKGRVVRFRGAMKIPHMGWNSVEIVRPSGIFDTIPNGSYFYFVHSYFPEPAGSLSRPPSPTTGCGLPPPCRRRISLPASSIRKRARQSASGC